MPEKGVFMFQFLAVDHTQGLDTAVLLIQKDTESQVHHHPPTLDDIQRRAYRIHREHGSVNGGYTLDDWLEAEHELVDVDEVTPADENDRVH